ncbi:EI24 domain-containing protein [Nocardia jiangxiensis]|uniref:EI24 domain-containing protein n=1 Tax=Nocardia jiangxiensis TaxID=282685 RepID=UPI000305FA0A|nr:EI24 domain-containing protein [Nocardia jiangxiensis]
MRDLAAGFGYLLQGQRWVATHRRRFGYALVPGLIALVLYVVAIVALAWFVGDVVAWATPFADHWASPWPDVLRGFLDVLLLVLCLFLAVITFTALTLALGQPFYEALAEHVDRSQSPDEVPGPGLSTWRSIKDGIALVLRALAWAVVLFAAGFLPVVGQTVVPVVGIGVTGFFLVQELTTVAMQRRGVTLRDQLKLLRSRRMLVWGFGIPLAAAFLVPFVAIVLMPGAVAGATLLTREVRGEPISSGN